ncbi:ABC transporter substrate-binding protein [Fictibacillus phosphorivorans]|uniref:ABC transporter substrate-binding protein n=1 Tax=Fictibacillus phosphorivorans TaxID=1221500 RepID=A0A165P7Q8_9BACL|nr:ABC transporter substrate-binding protein [Fictibacillus phosphorivorans]KZE69260.1 ABC transporter substrate-binding protein [Fictibacillus phosphorivorans]
MDNKLLILWRYFSSGSIRTEEIAEALQISQKQTTRYLKKWADEGWLSFTSGRGRGNVSKLKWLKDVEDIFEENVLRLIDSEPVEKSSKYLMFDWSTDTKMRLMNKFHAHFGFVQKTQDKLVVPKRFPFRTIHPLEAADAHSAHMVANVFNRLVFLTDQGEILPELAHSWDVSSTKLRLYLRKDVHFHDGSVLTADDVVNCLEKLRMHEENKELWSPVEKVFAKSSLVVDILYPGGCSYILQLLSTMTASIYKENKGRIYGTGSFILEENTDQKTTLTAFTEHFQERPLLDAVEFVLVPREFPIVYHSTLETENSDTFQVESDSGFGVLIMNAYREGSQIARKEIRQYIHQLVNLNRHKIQVYDPRATPNDNSCLIGQNQRITMTEIERPVFTEPLIVRVADHTEKTTRWLINMLEQDNIPFEIKRMSFEETIFNREQSQDVDLFIHGEIFELNQDLSFYFFLTNGFAPLPIILDKNQKWRERISQYIHTPFEEWTVLNVAFEKELIQEAIMIPLYYEKRYIPFSTELMNVNIKHFGYVDFSKLWVRPVIEE